MSPAEVCWAVYAAGMTVRADGPDLVLKPAERLTPALRELLMANKPQLIQFLHDAEDTTAELLRVSMRACDHHGDGEQARADMQADVNATPPHLRGDLLEHFRKTYGGQP